MIIARIAFNKGNKAEAITAAKHSIVNAYSPEKEDLLDEMGYTLKSDDINWDRPMINDGLGLIGFRWPAYPKNVLESKLLEPAWEEFTDKCNARIEELQTELVRLEKINFEQQQIRTQNLMAASQTGSTSATLFPALAPKAFIKLAPLVKGIEAVNNFTFADDFNAVINAYAKIPEMEKIETEAQAAVNKKFKDRFGEGKENPFSQHCEAENAVRNNFLIEANTTVEQRWRVYLNYASKQINNILYYRLYTQWPDEFEVSKVIAQISWLTHIKSQQVMFRNESSSCRYAQKKDTSAVGKLKEFDDIHCQYKSETDFIFGSINVECGKITAKLDVGMAKMMLKTKQGDKDNETFMDQFQSCSVEIGYNKGVGAGKGPLKVEAEAGIAGYLEIGKTGITDAGVKMGADIKVGTNVVTPLGVDVGPIGDMSTSIVGAEVKISMISGVTQKGNGVFSIFN